MIRESLLSVLVLDPGNKSPHSSLSCFDGALEIGIGVLYFKVILFLDVTLTVV